MLGWIAGFFKLGTGFHILLYAYFENQNREDSQRTPRVSNYSTDKHITSIIYHVEVSLCIEKKKYIL